MVEVITTDEFLGWYRGLGEGDAEAVGQVITMLETAGVSLRFPYSSDIKGTRHAIRELRIQSGGRPLRVFYAFDPRRDAVLILGGDKTGDNRFYQRLVPLVESVWEQYLREQGWRK